jgi:two-component system sensor kinase FixL
MFGWTAQEVIGQNIKLLMPEKYSKDHHIYLQNYLTTGVRKGTFSFNSKTYFE